MEKLIELAFIRNALFSKRFNNQDRDLLSLIKSKIINSNSIFKEIAVNAINNCEKDINLMDYDSAGKEIDLIHNFTFEDYSLWEQCHFYRIELLSYIELTKDVDRIKALIFLLGKLPRN